MISGKVNCEACIDSLVAVATTKFAYFDCYSRIV